MSRPTRRVVQPARASRAPAPRGDDRVTHLPGLGAVDGVQYAGYAPTRVGEPNAPGLFYWFAGPSQTRRHPTILWTNGGPGSSSFWGFFLENGPYTISPDGKRLHKRPMAWSDAANYLIFEHPLSVTLSFCADDHVPRDVAQGVREWYAALIGFVERHPEVAETPLILAGESYAGTYLPLLAQAILDGNRAGNIKLDLKLMVLCDAWVDPVTQMATDTTYALTHGLISAEQKRVLDQCYAGVTGLSNINAAIQALSGCYMANIAGQADPPFDPILTYLNRADVRRALHVPSTVPLTADWSARVGKNYAAGVNDSYVSAVQAVLDHGVRVRAVSGLNDAKDCNFLGTGAWLDKLGGDHARAFQLAPTRQWIGRTPHRVLGFAQSGGHLGWLKVLNAGHMAAMDQPELIDYVLAALP